MDLILILKPKRHFGLQMNKPSERRNQTQIYRRMSSYFHLAVERSLTRGKDISGQRSVYLYHLDALTTMPQAQINSGGVEILPLAIGGSVMTSTIFVCESVVNFSIGDGGSFDRVVDI